VANRLTRLIRRGTARRTEVGTVLTALVFAVRFVRWAIRRREDVVTEKLRPGQTLIITHRSEPS
jgi:hypothetical protein